MVSPLSVRLREGTKESHRLAEKSLFIRKFFAGDLSRDSYREFLVQLFHIYTAMEDNHEHHSEHVVLRKIHYPTLYRQEALIRDLDFYFENNDWRDLQPHEATQTYVQRIDALSSEWVEGLIAHHYTRYLGDLSGGQALKRIVAKTFQLSSSEGIAFYEFPGIEDYAQFKKKYRAQLDSMRIDEKTIQKIVNEANRAFDLNRGVFDSLAKMYQ